LLQSLLEVDNVIFTCFPFLFRFLSLEAEREDRPLAVGRRSLQRSVHTGCNLFANIESDTMATFVHQVTQLVSGLVIRLEQILLINSIHANAVVLHRNLNLELIHTAPGGLDCDKDGAFLVREFDRVRY
jgi:hypothetical protein